MTRKVQTAAVPAGAGDALRVLQMCLSFLADLNGGSTWIKDDGPGGADMRQRARALQRLAYGVVSKSRPGGVA